MSNLEQKFDALESQLANQHDALMARLADTNAKLDAIAAALGAPPPTQTATLQDVIDAIAATNIILADVHLDTQSIDQKALTIRDTLADVHLDTISMDQKLLRIRDAINPIDESLPVAPKSSIPWLLFRIMDAINPTWPRPTSVPVQPALDILLTLAQLHMPRLTEIDAAIGAPAGDATTTALGLLTSIQYSNAGIYTSTGISSGEGDNILDLLADRSGDCACASPNTVPDGCSAPFVSTDMLLIPYGSVSQAASVVVARWSEPLPSGIEFGSYFGLVDDHTELYSEDWSGWRVYVSSDQSQFATDPTNGTRYPTNAWLNLPPGARSYSFAVSERGGLKVTLCAPEPTEPTEPECSTYVVPHNQASPNVVTIDGITGRSYRVTLLNADNTAVVFGWNDEQNVPRSHYLELNNPLTIITGSNATMYSQYGFANPGQSPTIEVCLLPVEP